MHFDELLQQHIGECGRFQIICLIVLSGSSFMMGLNTMEVVFMTQTPPYQCADKGVPTDKGSPNATGDNLNGSHVEYRNLSNTQIWGNDACYYEEGQEVRGSGGEGQEVTSSLLNLTDLRTNQSCSNWIFNTRDTGETLVSQWSLVCGQQWLRSLVKSVYFMGQIPGVLLCGFAADRWGRQRALVSFFSLDIVMRIVMLTSPVIELFLTARFLSGGLGIAFTTCSFVHRVEQLGPRYRTYSILIGELSFTLGVLVSPVTAYLVRDWRHLQITNTVICVLLGIGFFFVPESPRWLFAVGRSREAFKVSRKMARINGKELPPELSLQVDKALPQEKGIKYSTSLRSRTFLGRLLPVQYLWFSIAMIYYGILMNVGALFGNIYINGVLMALTGFITIPTTKLMIDSRLGRVKSMGILFGLCGAVLLANIAFVSPHVGQTVFSMIGKVAIGNSFDIVYLSTSENFPTSLRSSVMGSSSMLARVGSSLCPFIILSATAYNHLPSIIFAMVSLLAMVLSLTLPETFGKKLPTSLSDMKERSGYLQGCCRKQCSGKKEVAGEMDVTDI